jgi:hypothetical protein
MISVDEFRTGQWSVPMGDADDLPEVCWQCVYLQYKGFSVTFSDSIYYFCAYFWPDKLTDNIPPCLAESL